MKLKLQNFKSYDPSYVADGRIGLSHGSKLDAEIVGEFLGNSDTLVYEAEVVKCKYPLLVKVGQEGYNRVATHKERVGQVFFRNALLSAYNGKCCVTGLAIPELLRASHIKPWAKSNDINEKANPQNGLLLNALHDCAFDSGYITIDFEYRIVVSDEICQHSEAEYIVRYAGKQIELPDKFLPGKRFIEYHNKNIFRRAQR